VDKRVTIDFSVRGVFVVALSLALLYLVYVLRGLLVLFFVAFIIETALEPIVDFLEKRRVPRALVVLALYVLAGVLLYLLVSLIVPPITQQVTELFESRREIAEQIGAYFQQAPADIRRLVVDVSSSLPERIYEFASRTVLANVLGGLFSGAVGTLTVLVVSFYLLLQRKDVIDSLFEWWPGRLGPRVESTAEKVLEKISLWVRGQIILSGTVGLLVFIGLTALGVDFAITLAAFAAVMELIPYVGPYIGAIPAVVLALAVSPLTALWVVLLYVAVQLLEGNLLVPRVMEATVGLSPVVIIFALLAGGSLLGILGVVIAVPVASAIAVILKEYRDSAAEGRPSGRMERGGEGPEAEPL